MGPVTLVCRSRTAGHSAVKASLLAEPSPQMTHICSRILWLVLHGRFSWSKAVFGRKLARKEEEKKPLMAAATQELLFLNLVLDDYQILMGAQYGL